MIRIQENRSPREYLQQRTSNGLSAKKVSGNIEVNPIMAYELRSNEVSRAEAEAEAEAEATHYIFLNANSKAITCSLRSLRDTPRFATRSLDLNCVVKPQTKTLNHQITIDYLNKSVYL